MDFLGIVGHAAEKFTHYRADGAPDAEETARAESEAREAIRGLILRHDPKVVVSGRSPMGGIDVWAVDEARRLGRIVREYAPTKNQWHGAGGYRERNLRIARACDHVACVVLRTLPEHFRGGPVFPGCYHCDGYVDSHPGPHFKSGGCWTARRAMALGKTAEWIVLPLAPPSTTR